MDQTFFGFSGKHRAELHSRLYDLLWAGDGRWDWETIYHLPLHIRRLWIMKLNKMNEEKEEARNSAKSKNTKPLPRGPKI